MLSRLSLGLDALGVRMGFTPDRRGLVRLGVATTLAYVALAFYPDRPYRVAREAAAWAAVLVLLFLYGQGRRIVREAPEGSLRVALAFFPLIALAAACVWPFHSADVYLYENAGRLQSAYGLDPYAAVPRDVPGWRDDKMLNDLWVDEAFPYGFLFAHEARLVASLAGENLRLAVALFKAVNVLALAALGALVFSTARALGRERPALSAYLLLWSPFLLVHHVANAHNDLLVGLLVVLALRFAVDGRWALAPAAVALAAAVKAPAAVVLPFVWLYLAKRRGTSRAVLGLLVAGGVFVLAGLPYLFHVRDFQWREIAASWAEPSYSFHDALLRTARALGFGGTTFRAVTQAALGAAFLVFLVARFLRARRRPAGDADGLVADSILVLIALLCVASSRFGPWYGAMFLPAALLLPEEHALRRLSLSLAAFELLAITFVGRARVLDALVMTGIPLAWALVSRGRRRTRGGLTSP